MPQKRGQYEYFTDSRTPCRTSPPASRILKHFTPPPSFRSVKSEPVLKTTETTRKKNACLPFFPRETGISCIIPHSKNPVTDLRLSSHNHLIIFHFHISPLFTSPRIHRSISFFTAFAPHSPQQSLFQTVEERRLLISDTHIPKCSGHISIQFDIENRGNIPCQLR